MSRIWPTEFRGQLESESDLDETEPVCPIVQPLSYLAVVASISLFAFPIRQNSIHKSKTTYVTKKKKRERELLKDCSKIQENVTNLRICTR